MKVRVIVLAKAPVPGRVKTRLCPPYTPGSAARLAAAALHDTIATVGATPVADRVLAVDGVHPVPAGWRVQPQRGAGLGERIADAFARPGIAAAATLLIGMDTPQVTAAGLMSAIRLLGSSDAVLGPAADGGWWALGLRDPRQAAVLRNIPTSTASTGTRTLAALRSRGLRVAELPMLRDVDTAADVAEVAALCAYGSRFAAAVATEQVVSAAAALAQEQAAASSLGTAVRP